VKNNHLLLSVGAICASIIILFFSCKKINSATELGGDLIPPIDNINTFDTTYNVEVYNDSFSITDDSTLYSAHLLNADYEQFLGMINNDPFFGKTDAKLYLQLKPSYYKYVFANRPDSLHIDSVVLVLDYLETYGDTNALQTVNVYEIDQSSDFRYDTTYMVRQNTVIKGNLLGSSTFAPKDIGDSMKIFKDTIASVANQLRIRLSDAFGQRLLNYDTTASPGHEDAYSSDSVFNSKFKGFALESVNGNAIMGFDLQGANTKLEIYYRYDKNSVLNADTIVTDFNFTDLSATANYVTREYSGTPLASALGGTTPDNFAFIQATPGTFATIKIPGLASLTNRVVHRAELIMEQAYDISDSTFRPPTYLYLDAYDPVESKFRTIPYDLSYDINGSPSLGSLGSYPFVSADVSGNTIRSWHFNISRYVQHIANGTQPAYDLRLYAPLYTYNQYKIDPTATGTTQFIAVNPSVAKGRVRLYGGDATQVNPHRMRLRIVYSKL
jgi:Domain of unknown function (DUF4270)